MWPDFDTARDVINLYKEIYIPIPSPNEEEDTFNYHCDQLWAVSDLLNYLRENWFENSPAELICDYIDDCRYRINKNKDTCMEKVYTAAKQTAESILRYFVCEV